jgi:diguanylate cyclase (GGDEF)-like protein
LAQVIPNPQLPLRTLVTARAAHDLTLQEARRSYPVHLRAVVTYYDPFIDSRHGALFVHDASGSIFVPVPPRPILPLKPGTEVEVIGVSGAGDYAPILANASVRVVGQSHLPLSAPKVEKTQLYSASLDGQWVEVEGMIHSVRLQPNNVSLEITTVGGPLTATSVREPSGNYDSLVDSLVRIHANAAPVFNRSRQMVGVHLFFPSLEALKVIQPAPPNLYATPLVPIIGILRCSPGVELRNLAHIRMTVTLQWQVRLLCIQQASDGLCMQTPQAAVVPIGELVDVVGFPAISEYKSTLDNATFQAVSGSATQPVQRITAEQAFSGNHDRELVQTEGELIGQDLAAADPTLMLRSGKFLFAAILPKGNPAGGRLPWKDGSILRVAGICDVRVDPRSTTQGVGFVHPDTVNILLRSVDDVAVLHAPSWWTPGHALTVLSIVGVVVLAAFAWIVVLRRRVEQQTQEIRLSEERLRHMSQHDALTGLPNRSLLNDRLDMALKRAGRFDSVLGLLMVDLDGFKEVNDSLGHHAGDRVLCEVATRIRATVRQTDTVARLGGDEFIVLLPDLHEAAQAEGIAAKIVATLSDPVAAGSATVVISASVGVCTSPPQACDAEKLLQCVDAAMYRAKACGKNGFHVSPGEPEKRERPSPPLPYPGLEASRS